MSHFPEARNVTSSCETRRNGGSYYFGITSTALFILSRMLSNRGGPNNAAAFLEQRGGSTKISTFGRGCWVPNSTDKSTHHELSPFTTEFHLNRCIHFAYTDLPVCARHHRTSWKSDRVCQIFAVSPWLIPNSMRKGVRRGEGEGSDLENFWVELSPPSSPPSPASPVLPNQLLLAVRRPPMISSSKADVVWGLECGMWEAGRVARGGKGRKEVLQTALINTLAREKRSATGPPWFKWPLNSFIYLWEWKTASFCILSRRLTHVSGQL